jgi:hypothetical protein
MSYELDTLTKNLFDPLVSPAVSAEIDWPIFVFFVPHPPLDWSLHHVLLLHELGHALYPNASLANIEIPIPPEFDPNTAKDLMERVERSKLLARFRQYFRAWSEELFSDAVGCLMSGASYLHAFCRVLCSFYAFDEPTSSHPPVAFRVHLCGRILDDKQLKPGGNQEAVVAGWTTEAERIHNSAAYIARDPSTKKLLPVLLRELEPVHQQLVLAAETSLGTRVYGPALVADDAKRAEHAATLGVPPIESAEIPALTDGPGDPLNAERIFAITWQAFCQVQHGVGAKSYDRSSRQAASLLEALDGAEAIRAWKAAK